MKTNELETFKSRLSTLLDKYPVIFKHSCYFDDETKNYMFKIKIKIISEKKTKFFDTVVIEGPIENDIDKLLSNIDDAIKEKVNFVNRIETKKVCCNY